MLPIPPGTHWSDAKPLIYPELPIEPVQQLPAPRKRAEKKLREDRPMGLLGGGLRFMTPEAIEAAAKPKREKKPKAKMNPKLIAAARELRDRWLERVNEIPMIGDGKYEVARDARPATRAEKKVPLLAA